MKRNFKSILAVTLATALSLALGVVTVFAEDNVSQSTIGDVQIVDTVLTHYSTFFLLEDGTLWSNDGEGNFVQVYENVKSVSTGDFSDLFIILKDNTLLYGNIYKDYDPSLEVVAKDVKSATGSSSDMYILKTDGTVWHSGTDFDTLLSSSEATLVEETTTEATEEATTVATEEILEDSNIEESTTEVISEVVASTTSVIDPNIGVETISVSSSKTIELSKEFSQIAENGQKIYSKGGLLFIIDNNNGLWVYGKDMYRSYLPITTPKLIMENVSDVELSYNGAFITDTSKNLYFFEFPNTYDSSKSIFDGELNLTLISENVKSTEAIDDGYLFVKEDGTLWSTGENYYYNLGFESSSSEELVKIDEGVEDVYSDNNSHTLYLKEDGSYWGMGDNSSKQLGIVPYTGENYFDETGKRFIASDVEDMFLGRDFSGITKIDGTLWQLGSSFNGELPTEAEVSKIADEVSFATPVDSYNFAYVTGENKDLYFNNNDIYIYNLIISDENFFVNTYLEVLKLLGYEVSGSDSSADELERISSTMSEQDVLEFEEAYRKYVDEKYGSTPAASDVVDFDYFYYLDSKNNLYHFNFEGEDDLIAKNVKDFSVGDREIYIVDMDNNLLYTSLVSTETITVNTTFDEYSKDKDFKALGITSIYSQEEETEDGTITTNITFYRDKDTYDFEATEFKNIDTVEKTLSGFSVLDLDGVLSIYQESHQYFNVEREEAAPKVLIGDKSFYKTKEIENVKSYDGDFSSFVYVTLDDELWVMGSNYGSALGDSEVYGEYISEPVKFMDNVEKVVLENANTLVLTTNNELYGMGQNASGQLGFAPQGNVNKKTTVILPTELTLNFIVK